jgi:hypothetical protein
MTIREERIPVQASENGIEQVLSSPPPSEHHTNVVNNGCSSSSNNNNKSGDNTASNNAGTTNSSSTSHVGDEFYGNGNATGDDDDDEEEGSPRERRKLQHWKNSPFAVGVVNVTWKDDLPAWFGNDAPASEIDESMAASAICCGCLGADRVGNMAVLAQSTEQYSYETIDQETGQVVTRTKQRPKLLWVIGPYWTVNVFITWPLILGVSGWICYRRVFGNHIAVVITWSICTFLMILSLCMISCRNPGILHRYHEPPPETEDWRWNDQAKTYRPPKARFDPETQVVVEGFDHT